MAAKSDAEGTVKLTQKLPFWSRNVLSPEPGINDLETSGSSSFAPKSINLTVPSNYLGIQDLSIPYGKIHRVHDDERIPVDNPHYLSPNVAPVGAKMASRKR